MTTQKISSKLGQGGITLTIDFGNHVQKTFADLPSQPLPEPLLERDGMSVISVLDQACARRPGLSYVFEKSGIDRSHREMGNIAEVDGVKAPDSDQKWQVWVNRTPFSELRRVTPTSIRKSGEPEVRPGDTVLLKLGTPSPDAR